MNEIEKTFLKWGLKGMNVYEFNRTVEFYMSTLSMTSEQVDATFLLGKLKELKIEELRLLCESNIESGFTATNGHFYRMNRDDQLNMIGQKDFLQDNPEENVVYWKTEDAGYISHTREEWMSIHSQAFLDKKEKLFKYDGLRTRVRNATTSDEVVSIFWDEPAIVEPETIPTEEVTTTETKPTATPEETVV